VRLAIVCATGWFADTRDAAADRPLPGPQSVGCRSPVRAAARRLDLHGKPWPRERDRGGARVPARRSTRSRKSPALFRTNWLRGMRSRQPLLCPCWPVTQVYEPGLETCQGCHCRWGVVRLGRGSSGRWCGIADLVAAW
jgi:hypothetical protein